MSRAQERLYKSDLNSVRADHIARYRWAAKLLQGACVIDAACGCGYGSAVLADAGCEVQAFDVSPEAIAYARQHWARPDVEWIVADLHDAIFSPVDAVVSFETIEHLRQPEVFLRAACDASPRLLASVPNALVWPHDAKKQPFHFRHYTQDQFDELLTQCGWKARNWFGQADKFSLVAADLAGRTLIVEAVRA